MGRGVNDSVAAHALFASRPLVLASGSPRRQAMLRAAGLPFTVRVSGVDEDAFRGESPAMVALATAQAKAEQVSAGLPGETLVLAADTMVVLGQTVFNKPGDPAEARQMLGTLAGRTHEVVTAVVLRRAGGPVLGEPVSAQVTFNPLSPELIDAYVASGEAADKAGSYGIQGLGAQFVARVEGDLTGVIGLPLGRLRTLFIELTGVDPFAGQSLRTLAREAFPELSRLPQACLTGIPD